MVENIAPADTSPDTAGGEGIKAFLRSVLLDVASLDPKVQAAAIERAYDPGCELQNPYMVLHGREEILKSYHAFSTSNTAVHVQLDSVSYDAHSQICMVDMWQTIHPKTLGGVVGIKMHLILKLQLELEGKEEGVLRMTGTNNNSPERHPPAGLPCCRIVNHEEIHVTSDLLSQVPLVGGFYDHTLRSAMGQLSIAGTSLLHYTGILDLVPRAVKRTHESARAMRDRAGALAACTYRLGVGTLDATGVSSLLRWASENGKCAAVTLMERGSGEPPVSCYVPTCSPGKVCYSPTCVRSTPPHWLSREVVAGVVRGVYVGAFPSARRKSPGASVAAPAAVVAATAERGEAVSGRTA